MMKYFPKTLKNVIFFGKFIKNDSPMKYFLYICTPKLCG